MLLCFCQQRNLHTGRKGATRWASCTRPQVRSLEALTKQVSFWKKTLALISVKARMLELKLRTDV